MVDTRSVAPEEDALLDVTQRLTRQIEQQLAQLRRLRERARAEGPVPAILGDLEHVTRRMQRDGERLRILCGARASVAGARSVADVLGDAAAAASEPVRVTVRPAPIATVSALASVELVHVLAEVLDSALAGTALDVTLGARLGPAGLTVDVVPDGPTRDRGPIPVAEALARRTATGVQLHRPDSAAESGPFAIVLCPSGELTVPLQRRPDVDDATRLESLRSRRPDPLTDPLPPEGTQPAEDGPLAARAPRGRSGSPLGQNMFGVRSAGSAGGSALFGRSGEGGVRRNGNGGGGAANGNGRGGPHGAVAQPAAPGAVSAVGSAGRNADAAGSVTTPEAGPVAPAEPDRPADAPGPVVDLPSGAEALFGPLPGGGRDPVQTPIYEAVASAWFREGGTAADWEAAGDVEWQAATARAASTGGEQADTTASGLPRRRPGRQMVTPPLRRSTAAQPRESRASEEREPERVRERLDGYQRGLRQGRHRAGESDPPAGRSARWA
ncbi:hypothetical protein [Pseudonocardia sp.]|uniref:hypothetical protein n=1 Tax=Pseudonocardia sp. TaxID=60912 RepID=UPI003D0FEF78